MENVCLNIRNMGNTNKFKRIKDFWNSNWYKLTYRNIMNFNKTHQNKLHYGQFGKPLALDDKQSWKTSNIHILQIFWIIHLELFSVKFEYFLRNHKHKSEKLKRKTTF